MSFLCFNCSLISISSGTKHSCIPVGLQKILSLLEADDADVRIHAVKVVANLAAEGKYNPFLMFFNYYLFICPDRFFFNSRIGILCFLVNY